MKAAATAGATLAACMLCATGAAAGLAAQAQVADASTVTPLSRRLVDGRDDDLLTAGLGLEGLRAATPPGFADALHPTPVELRRRAVYFAWRGLVDLSPDGGAGRFFGPRAAQRIAGIERLGALRLPGAAGVDAVLLQVPTDFDPRDPCLIVVASSGSRGVFGALPTAGEWGLRHGCAVVTTDKGTGNGFFDPAQGIAIRIDGVVTRDPADPLVGFRPDAPPVLADASASTAGTSAGSDAAAWSNAYADADARAGADANTGAGAGSNAGSGSATGLPWLLSKHAHSGIDPQPRWGERLIAATRVAFDWLNEEYRGRLPRPLAPANTRVIAAGISNGGAVVLRALELDRGPPQERWFDGAVVAEPNAIVAAALPRLALAGTGGAAPREVAVRGLLDYATLHALLQPCALLAQPDPAAPFAAATAGLRAAYEAWCADLAAHGELPGADVAAQAAAARARLLAAGVEPGALRLGHVNVASQLWLSIATTYLHAHAAARPGERACELGFAALDAAGRPRAPSDEEWASLYSDGVGIPPTAGIGIVRADGLAANQPATMRCLRAWVEAALAAPGAPAPTAAVGTGLGADFAERLRTGLDAIQMRADPGARPVIVLHGRLDALIPVNHSSRPWYVAAKRREVRAELRYYEVEHGQHFDAFLALPGFAAAHLPMQPHLLAGMDLMDARLRRGKALPPSQVLRSRLRAALPDGGVAPLEAANLGSIRPRPSAADRIELRGAVLHVPD